MAHFDRAWAIGRKIEQKMPRQNDGERLPSRHLRLKHLSDLADRKSPPRSYVVASLKHPSQTQSKNRGKRLVPPQGIEPWTFSLQVSCSTG